MKAFIYNKYEEVERFMEDKRKEEWVCVNASSLYRLKGFQLESFEMGCSLTPGQVDLVNSRVFPLGVPAGQE